MAFPPLNLALVLKFGNLKELIFIWDFLSLPRLPGPPVFSHKQAWPGGNQNADTNFPLPLSEGHGQCQSDRRAAFQAAGCQRLEKTLLPDIVLKKIIIK